MRKTIELLPDSVTIYEMEIPYNTTIYRQMKAEGKLAALLLMPEHRHCSVQGKVHLLLAHQPLIPIEQIYRLVFEKQQ